MIDVLPLFIRLSLLFFALALPPKPKPSLSLPHSLSSTSLNFLPAMKPAMLAPIWAPSSQSAHLREHKKKEHVMRGEKTPHLFCANELSFLPFPVQ
jgi:hypothetical protein